MSSSAAQLQFAAEFVLFVAAASAAASGVAAVTLAPGRPRASRASPALLGLGLLLLATSAFLHGSQLVAEGESLLIVSMRAAGVLLAAAGSVAWAVGPVPAALLRGGLVLVAVAVGAELAGSSNAASGLLALAGAAIGVSVLAASRGSVAARVAASAAVSLLIVVLVLGVALSAVLVSTVQEGAVDRLERRAANEATGASKSFTDRLDDAKLVAASLKGSRLADLRRLAASSASSSVLADELATLSRSFLADVALAYVTPSGKVQGVVPGVVRLDSATVVGLPRSEVVRQALRRGGARGSVTVLGGQALVVGAQPVVDNERGSSVIGVAVAVSELDATYLALAGADDPDLALALAGRRTVLARRGPQPRLESILPLLSAALDAGTRRSAIVGGRFVAVAPVESADGRPVLAVIASTPTTLVNETRNSVFRNLFLIALGGTFFALVFATLVGNRIGARLRRLTGAVQAIEQGDLSSRTGMSTVVGPSPERHWRGPDSDDEVGVLARSFDAMAASVQEKTIAESSLRERLEAVVGGMGEALVAVDVIGNVTDFNRAAEQLLGISAGKAVGRRFTDIVSVVGDDGSDLTLPSPGSPRSWSGQGWVVGADGDDVPVAVSSGPVRGPGAGAGGTVFVLRDLRREREVEQMKTEFLSRIGHELRTPLTGIIGYTDLLSRKRVPAERALTWHGEILKQSRALLRVVEMLEFFASAGAGRVSLRLEDTEPRVILDGVVKRWRARLGRPRALRRRVERDLPQVRVDRRLLSSCLDELIANAVKFSPEGSTILIEGARAADGSLELSVTDQGEGMSSEEQSRVLADFVQGDTSDTRAQGGLGLGLSFVQRVVEAHGGGLVCESAPKMGSKFSILLPSVPNEVTP